MIVFNKERMADLQDELMPLFEEHKEEAFAFPFLNTAPSWDVYDDSERLGSHHFYTAREEDTGELVGYAGYWTMPDTHFSEEIFGYQDLLFLDQRYRRSGVSLDLIKFAEDDMIENFDVSVLTLTLKTKFNTESLPNALGYDSEEISYIKYVGDI